tara:strand:- start:2318 stop:3220 length:903 start_codon:yes stop_codon:yes gene_type:complete
MAWIKSSQEVASHPKTLMLATRLDISVPQAIGHIHLLWWWALDYCKDGYLTRYREYIPMAAQWEGDGEDFTKALIEFGWVDEIDDELIIHDWMEWTGKLETVREADRERKRKARSSANSKNSANREWDWDGRDDNSLDNTNSDVRGMSVGRPEDVQTPSSVRGEEKRGDESRGDIVPSEPTEIIEQVEIINNDEVSHGSVFTALVDVFEYNVNDLTKSTRGQLNKAAKELKEVGATAHDIRARAQNFILTYGWKPTPLALVKHWADLRQAKPKLDPKELQKLQSKVTTARNLNDWTNEDE